MNPIYSHIYIDFQHKTIDSINLKQYDYESRYIRFHISDNGKPYILTSDLNAEIKINKSDGTKVVNFATVDCSNNHVEVKITNQMTSVYGTFNAEITLFQNGIVISTMPFIINVEKSPVQNDDIISSNEYGVIEKLISDVRLDEESRQLNEENRKESENIRNYNEETRKNNENSRIENENTRKTAEIDRTNNEKIRNDNEQNRILNEGTRQTQEASREEKTSTAIANSQKATQDAINATTDLQNKLDNHHFVLTEDKDTATGVPSLDANCKIPINELYDASTESKGIVKLVDSIDSDSITTAATPKSVKIVYDALVEEKNRLSNVENKSSETIRSEITKANVTSALGYSPYTPTEIDNKLSTLETNIDWKESVNTYDDILSTYPNPQDGWTVNVKDTDYTYRYNGSEWVTISANAIPKATQFVDGLLSKEDKINYDDANDKKHIHSNKSILDSITSESIDAWNKIDPNHNHDNRYYTETEVNNLLEKKVSGVKGNSESSYRRGNVNITAEDIGIENATENKAGLVKPDGETTEVDEDGTLHVIGNEGTIDYEELENKPQINGHELIGRKTLEQIGGASVVELTQSEYDALPESKLTDGKLYMIKNGAVEDLFDNAIMHRNRFRGKNLGNSLTEKQLASIRDGSFDDLYVGDFWVMVGYVWRIVDIDYWLGTGDISCSAHHLVIMPDTALYTERMNDTSTTEGGYANSRGRGESLRSAREGIIARFGSDNILNHRELLTNAIMDGHPSSAIWYDSTVELPNEIMMYGCYINTPAGDGSFVPARLTIDKTQLALMQMCPRFINPGRQSQWLRDVVSDTRFAFIGTDCLADYSGAAGHYGMRPIFGIA